MAAKPARCEFPGVFGVWCANIACWQINDPHLPDKFYRACDRHLAEACHCAEYTVTGEPAQLVVTLIYDGKWKR